MRIGASALKPAMTVASIDTGQCLNQAEPASVRATTLDILTLTAVPVIYYADPGSLIGEGCRAPLAGTLHADYAAQPTPEAWLDKVGSWAYVLCELKS